MLKKKVEIMEQAKTEAKKKRVKEKTSIIPCLHPFENKIGEPLSGRSNYLYLFPIVHSELNEDYISYKENLESKLVYGMYPRVITSRTLNDKTDVLNSIKNGYLLKDVLELNNQKDSTFIIKLLHLIAFQIGNDISYSELATNLNE